MRQILFRGKDTQTKQWHYGYLQFHYVQGRDTNGLVFVGMSRIFDQENNKSYDVITDTVGQFTGELDDRGDMIFEGDRVHYQCGAEHSGYREFSEVLEVRYVGMEFTLYNNRTGITYSDNMLYAERLVVGDIYES